MRGFIAGFLTATVLAAAFFALGPGRPLVAGSPAPSALAPAPAPAPASELDARRAGPPATAGTAATAGPLVAPPAPPPPAIPFANSRARIKFESTRHDFGTAPHGEKVKHVFKYSNAGEETLEVRNVRTTCGCTAAEPTKRSLAPGESGQVEVVFDTSKKGAGRGKQRWSNSVFFASNDPTQRENNQPGMSKLVLEGDVTARYRLVPEAGLFFRSFAQGTAENLTATAEIFPTSEPPPGEPPVPPLVPEEGGARVLAAPANVKVLALRAIERDGVRGVAVDCAVSGDVPQGVIQGAVRVATGHPRQPEVSVPVHGYVLPAVQAQPPRVYLPRETPNAARAVLIRSGRPVEVIATAVQTDDGAPPPVSVETPPGQQVVIRFAEGADLGRGTAGEVLLFLSDPKNPLLRVPYSIRSSKDQAGDLQAQVAAGVRISPAELALGDVEPGREFEAVVVVTRAQGPPPPRVPGGLTPGEPPAAIPQTPPIAPSGLEVEPVGLLEARIEPLQAGQVYRIHVKPTSGGPSGPIAARVSFVPREGAARVGFRVTGRSLPKTAASPEALHLARGAGIGEARVALRRKDGQTLKVLQAKEPSGRYSLRVEVGADGAPVVVAALASGGSGTEPAPPPGAPKARATAVVVTTDDPEEREVRIPLVERIGP